MSSQYWNSSPMKLTTAILFLFVLVPLMNIAAEKEAKESTLPRTSVKCGECPCVNTCGQQQLPPPPAPPSISQQYCPPPPHPPSLPPPPRFYYFSGPDQGQGEQTAQVSTPPPPRFTYVTGSPPGNLYPTDPFSLEIYNGAVPIRCGMLLLLICGFLQILVFYQGA